MSFGWLDNLTAESTLAELPAHEAVVSPQTPGHLVAAHLERHPSVPGILICQDDQLVGLVSRAVFFQRMSRQFSREVYLLRPIGIFLDGSVPEPFRLSADCRIRVAAARALERAPDLAYEPIVVDTAGGALAGTTKPPRLIDAYVLLRAQARLLALAQLAMVQNEKLASLGQLAAGVAHEINNPLAFVNNNLAVIQRDLRPVVEALRLYRDANELLSARPEIADRLRTLAERADLDYTVPNLGDLVSRARIGVERIRQIVRDLSNFAHPDDGERGETDLNADVRSTANLVSHRAEERQVRLELDLADLPRIACFPAKLNQVVLNLLTNALDACNPGGCVTVRTRVQPHGQLLIEVQDDGAGIDPVIRQRIFDPFFTTKPQGHGTGLGLSVSYGIVRDHGGSIEVESEPGRGSTFRVVIPLEPPVTAPPPPPPPPRGSFVDA